jgi:prepilin signal peptidase PulO-like enzyme (type II secretory pathway)
MSYALLFGITLTIILGGIVWVDSRKMIIPDVLNGALAGTGLAYQVLASPGAIWFHVATGLAAAAVFWLIRRIHASSTGRVGLGLGDVKMAGASAIWLSPWNLPLFVFVASVSALIFAAGRHLLRKDLSASLRQPFGPFLSAGLLLTWLGEQHFPHLLGL